MLLLEHLKSLRKLQLHRSLLLVLNSKNQLLQL